MACYYEALRLNPDAAEAYNNLGIARALQGRRDEARDNYHAALRLQPHYAEALNNLGELLQEEGRFEEALAFHRQGLQLKPDYVDGLTKQVRRINLTRHLLMNSFSDQGEAHEPT